jgi:hypothetical protein
MAVVTAIEFAWWVINWGLGFAAAPFLLTYLIVAFAGLACVSLVRAVLMRPQPANTNWPNAFGATILLAIGASLFLPLKSAIPQILPFWLDPPLARAERAVFTTDPWFLLDRLFGWAAVPIDSVYALWLPTQLLCLFMIVTEPPSTAKSRALIAYVLAWFLLGVAAALLLSSAGPIFHDRIFGDAAFAALPETLRNRGAWIVLAESDRMWSSLSSGTPDIVSGISAVPSIHVAISVWMFLAARTLSPRAAPIALAYAVFVWVASVQLGWHYVTDGLVGIIGMIAVWAMSRAVERHLRAA